MGTKTRRALQALTVVAITLTSVTSLSSPASAAGGTDERGVFTNASGSVQYEAHLPPSYRAGTPMPVLVAVHGCSMTGYEANSMKATSEFDDLADARGFIVLYPTQDRARNAAGCWNALDRKHQVRGSGEPSLIAGATQAVLAKYGADAKRVYTVGASSGAGMAVILGATYPDVFTATGSLAGGEYAADRILLGATPLDTAKLVYAQMGPRARQVPLFIMHGDADTTVPPALSDRLLTQWAAVDDLANDGKLDGDVDDVAETRQRVVNTGARPYVKTVYTDAKTREPLIEKYVIEGLAHRWPGGGVGDYVDPLGPELSDLVWNFFSGYAKP